MHNAYVPGQKWLTCPIWLLLLSGFLQPYRVIAAQLWHYTHCCLIVHILDIKTTTIDNFLDAYMQPSTVFAGRYVSNNSKVTGSLARMI
jgi:hypothetical protein